MLSNSDIDWPSPMILGVVDETEGRINQKFGLEVSDHRYNPSRRDVIYFQGKIMLLYDPKSGSGRTLPSYELALPGDVSIYDFDMVSTGDEEIVNHFKNFPGMEFYAGLIQEDRLIRQRSKFGKVLESAGLAFILPPKLSFKKS